MSTVIWIGEKDREVLDILEQVFASEPRAELVIPEGDSPTDAELAEVEAILNGAGTIGADLMDGAPKLRIIQRVGAGTDGIDFAAAAQRDILVANMPGANSVAVAELAMASLLACARHLPGLDANTRAGTWAPNEWLHSSYELSGRRAAIIGLGHIGQLLARRLRAFDMELAYYDVFRQPAEVEQEIGIEYRELADLLPGADVLSIHVPLTDETRGLIGAEELALMSDSAIVLNMSRPGIVDEQALADALRAGTIAGAGFDVFTGEPDIADNPLLSAPNVVATPHAGAQTHDTVTRVFTKSLANVLTLAEGGRPDHVID
ncbi:2-hydroxyacid dehydrogenase [Brevibacterium ihuae]|uniref:2-hydroxyacid dehydrogenase n=1 Tax=Brevibacterium ihuae TaxID=1631743 RepID=UPI0015E0997B|nr:2-hydroxyacid dehydrogenase [Brevibacterium ihuae]